MLESKQGSHGGKRCWDYVSHTVTGGQTLYRSVTYMLFKTSVYEGLKRKGKGDITVCFRQWNNTKSYYIINKGYFELFCPSFSKAFPRKSSVTKTPRIASDSDIQGSKDAVIQDLERKLRFKEERISNGQQVCVCMCVSVWNTEQCVCRQLLNELVQ